MVLIVSSAPVVVAMASSLVIMLLSILPTNVHGILSFQDALHKDPSFAGASPVGECLVLVNHASSRDFVRFFTSHVWDVVVIGVRAVLSVVVNIIPTEKSVEKVHVS